MLNQIMLHGKTQLADANARKGIYDNLYDKFHKPNLHEKKQSDL